ncbi:MAG TPA: lytic murein transglycosylase, partial [Halomonas sp.]|nr:lytic murein transglycosylase [Halomonas sp.]
MANPQLMTDVDARAAEEVRYGNFNEWLREFRRYAANQGISEATLASAFDGLRYRERVIELDRYQPEFVRAIWQYLDSAVSSTRVANGQEKLAQHRDTAQAMQQRYGV